MTCYSRISSIFIWVNLITTSLRPNLESWLGLGKSSPNGRKIQVKYYNLPRFMGYTMIYRQVDYFNTHIVFHQNYAMCFLSGTLVEMAAAARPSEWVQRIWRSLRFQEPVPSGKRLQNYGKSRCSMGKSTFSMVIFNSYISHYQRVNDNVAKVISPNTQPILQYCHRLVVQIIPKPWACHQVYHINEKNRCCLYWPKPIDG